MASSIISGIHGLVQAYKSDPVYILVTTNEDGVRMGRIVRVSHEFQPSGRIKIMAFLKIKIKTHATYNRWRSQ